MVFKLPSGARAFIKGAATAGVGMMAQQAKEDREDIVLEGERDFKSRLQKDRIYETKLANIETNAEKFAQKTKADLEIEKKRLDGFKEDLYAQGYTKPMVATLETQGFLKTGMFNVFFNKYNAPMFDLTGEADWINAKGNDGLTFQENYVNQYQDFILNKGENADSAFKFKNTSDTLKNTNNISDNIVETQLKDSQVQDSQGFDAAILTSGTGVDTSTNVETIDTAPVVIQTDTSADVVSSSSGVLSNYAKAAQPLEIFLSKEDIENPNWNLTAINPNGLKEGEVVKLTLDKSGQYKSTLIARGTIYDDSKPATERTGKIMAAIKSEPGLLPSSDDITSAADRVSLDTRNNLKYVSLISYAQALDAAYQANGVVVQIPQLISFAKILHNSSDTTYATNTVTNIEAKNADVAEIQGLQIVLGDVDNILRQIGSLGLPSETAEQQQVINNIQRTAIAKYKHNFAINYVDENKMGNYAVQQAYKDMVKIIDKIMQDKNKGPDGNQGNYWITETGQELELNYGTTRINTEAFSTDDQYNEIFNKDVIEKKSKIDSVIKDGKTNYDLSRINIGDTTKVGARSGTSNINPNIAKFTQLKKDIEKLNGLESQSKISKGSKIRNKNIIILKEKIEKTIKELQE